MTKYKKEVNSRKTIAKEQKAAKMTENNTDPFLYE